MLTQAKIDSILSSLSIAEKEMQRDYSKDRIVLAKQSIEAGFAESVLNAPIIRNIINLIVPFVRNDKIKKAINLLREGLDEEKTKTEKRRR